MIAKLITLSLAVIIVVTGGVCLQVWHFVKTPAHSEKKEILFEIQSGEGLRKISTKLQEDGLIKSSLFFEVYVRAFHPGVKIKMGEYQLFTDMNPAQIFSVLVSGKSFERTFTVAEGLNIYDIADLFESKGYGKKNEFL